MGEQSIDPYLIPGIGVLRNRVGLTDAASLAAAEYALSMGRLLELSQMDVSAQGTVSQLQWIHHYLFQDVYDWAGQLRTVNIEKEAAFSFRSRCSIRAFPTVNRCFMTMDFYAAWTASGSFIG